MRKGIWGFALVAIVLLMASCSSESEYANAIPKDAAMVMSFDFKTMAEKSGINGKGGEKVVAKLTDALKSGLEGEAYKTAEKIIQNPSESGLSFTDKVYMFITPHSNAFALLAKVDDEGKVEALLEALKNEQICTELKSESGCTWTQMGTALCAFNKGTFLLMGSNKRQNECPTAPSDGKSWNAKRISNMRSAWLRNLSSCWRIRITFCLLMLQR